MRRPIMVRVGPDFDPNPTALLAFRNSWLLAFENLNFAASL